jgi:hypothetical protein
MWQGLCVLIAILSSERHSVEHQEIPGDELDLDSRDPVLGGRFGKDQAHTEPILYDKILSGSTWDELDLSELPGAIR